METKKDIFREHLLPYIKSDKKGRGDILSHVCFITGLHRKTAIGKFRRLWLKGSDLADRRGKKEYYGVDVTVALKMIWEAGGEVCGELLHPVIPEYVDILKRDQMWDYSEVLTGKLLAMSLATVKRRVGKFRKVRQKRNGISDTKPSHIKHLVPIFIGPWKGKPPGFGQVDTVRHSNTASGDAVYTLNYTDAATLTTILRAQWNKGQLATRQSMQAIKGKLPFPWLGAHPDTGSEFLNYLVMDWCKAENIELSRSRPSHKNDNMYVEERNGHAVRKTIGYIALNCPEAVPALNAVYGSLNPYLLHFVAVRRCLSKERLQSKYKRIYEPIAKTPYQRILEHPEVAQLAKNKLKLEHEKLNPLFLKQTIDRCLKTLYDIQRRFGNQR
ncbi:MAG: hypothetical protein NTZ18_02325 [Candidatus Komeilibacteria bacterium]|nr:hypothetical protein [Candidatus Komeilibacteria bacterium]